MSTKDEIQAAVKARFRTATMEIAPGVEVTFRELSEAEGIALDKACFTTGPDGKRTINPDGLFMPRWLAATIAPAFTVEELGTWPAQLIGQAWTKCQEVNGSPSDDKVATVEGKNS